MKNEKSFFEDPFDWIFVSHQNALFLNINFKEITFNEKNKNKAALLLKRKDTNFIVEHYNASIPDIIHRCKDDRFTICNNNRVFMLCHKTTFITHQCPTIVECFGICGNSCNECFNSNAVIIPYTVFCNVLLFRCVASTLPAATAAFQKSTGPTCNGSEPDENIP